MILPSVGGSAAHLTKAGSREVTMFRILTLAALAAATLTATIPARAGWTSNALSANALTTNGSAIDNLDGVMVEAVSLPRGAQR
jgi:hypothetical protein